MTKQGAFFLDRDGTINIDRVYINDPRLMELCPGAAKAIRAIHDAGYYVVVVTNQSGVGRGIIEPGTLPLIHHRLDQLLLMEAGAKIDLYKVCLHTPNDKCDCRKPGIKLVEEAVAELNIDLKKSVFVGDKLTDIEAGKRSGCRYSTLIRTGKGQAEEVQAQIKQLSPMETADYIADDLLQATVWALDRLQRV